MREPPGIAVAQPLSVSYDVVEAMDDAAVPEQPARRVAADHHVWIAIASFAGATGGRYEDTVGGSGIWEPDGVAVGRLGSQTGTVARPRLINT